MSSLRAISEATGFSVATVSRALRGNLKVRNRTAEKVLKAADRLGYQRNQHLGEMMSAVRRRTSGAFHGNLALIWPARKRFWIGDRPLREMRAAVFRRASELHFSMDELFFSPENHRDLRDILLSRGVHGLIFSTPSSIVSGFEIPMDLEGFACVALGSGLARPALDRVLFDTFSAMRLAVTEAGKLFAEGVAALWDFSSESATGHTARGAFLAHHPGGPARAEELFWDRAKLNRTLVSNALKKHQVRCLILFPRLLPPTWLLNLIPSSNLIWLNYPAKKGGAGWVDPQNQLLGARAVDLLAAKIHINQAGVTPSFHSIVIPPKWVAGKA